MNKKEKWVLQLCHSYSPPFDDVARQWFTLFEGSPYKVLTVFLTGRLDERVSSSVGGDVVFLEYTSKDLKGLKRQQIKRIKSLHHEFHFSFAVAHRYKATFIASHIPNLNLVGVSHAFGVYKPFFRRWYVMRKAESLLLAGVSDAIRDDAKKSLPNYPERNVQTVHNHIDLEKHLNGLFDRVTAREKLGLDDSGFIVGNVGRLHPDKDQKTLIKAFAMALPLMPGARLVVIGEGRLKSELEYLIDSLGCSSSIILLGSVFEAWRYYKAFDVFALSSYYEPFGMVLLEAMAAEIPVICSACGGGAEVVGDKGLLFNVGDSDDLSACLKKIFSSDQEYRDKMASDLMLRLKENFTDESVRGRFWQIPFVREKLL
jgi:glycosyltransferase involved in cell wall biosynthesis